MTGDRTALDAALARILAAALIAEVRTEAHRQSLEDVEGRPAVNGSGLCHGGDDAHEPDKRSTDSPT